MRRTASPSTRSPQLARKTLAAAALLAATATAGATEYTYRGQLSDAGKPAHGRYDLQITAYADAETERPLIAPITLEDVAVVDGAFATAIDLPEALGSTDTWICLAVRDGHTTGAFERLPTREKLETAAVCPSTWLTTGNAGLSAATNFLGTTDNVALQLRSNNRRVLNAATSSELNGGAIVESVNWAAGDFQNLIGPDTTGVTIGGGGGRSIQGGTTSLANQAYGHFNTIAGGSNNRTGVSGTAPNAISGATVSGGRDNIAAGSQSTVSGGVSNNAQANFSAIGGGFDNDATAEYATVGGGSSNAASATYATASGGADNDASGQYSAVAGGLDNDAVGDYATIAGGDQNRAPGARATVPGGSFNSAGAANSFAAGSFAAVRTPAAAGDADGDAGTFIWADGAPTASFTSTANNQFLVRARGGMAINTTTKPGGVAPVDSELTLTSNTARPDTNVDIAMYPAGGTHGYSLGVAGSNVNNTVFFISKNDGAAFQARFQIDADGTTRNSFGTWSTLSDARLKRDVQPIASPLDRILGLRGVTFEYDAAKAPMASPGRRAGFIAQQVERVFPEWVSETSDGYKQITPIGFEAVLVEALRESHTRSEIADAQLEARLDALAQELAQLQADNAQLRLALARYTPAATDRGGADRARAPTTTHQASEGAAQ